MKDIITQENGFVISPIFDIVVSFVRWENIMAPAGHCYSLVNKSTINDSKIITSKKITGKKSKVSKSVFLDFHSWNCATCTPLFTGELHDMLADIEEEEPTGYIRYEKFLPMMTKVLMQRKYVINFSVCFKLATKLL